MTDSQLDWLYQDDHELQEGEVEAEWLRRIGFESVAAKYESGQLIDNHTVKRELSFLTRNQREAVRRRVATLNRTIKKRRTAVRSDTETAFLQHSQTADDFTRTQSMFNDQQYDAPDYDEPPLPGAATGYLDDTRRKSPSTVNSSNDHPDGTCTPQSDLSDGELEQHFRLIDSDSSDSTYPPYPQPRRQPAAPAAAAPPKPPRHTPSPSSGHRVLSRSPHRPPAGAPQRSSPHQETTAAAATPVCLFETSFTSTTPKTHQWTTARNGVSVVYDLSTQDMKTISALALIELTALLDKYNIPTTIPKKLPKVKPKDTGVFGRSLTAMVEEESRRDPFKHIQSPRFVLELIRHLLTSVKEDGILRLAGRAKRIKDWRDVIDQTFSSKPLDWNSIKPHDAVSLLKQFLKELPVPLLTWEFIHLFPKVSMLDQDDKIQALNLLVLMLPPPHSHTLKLLVLYLAEVVSHSPDNRMTLDNVCTIMSPNLFLNFHDRKKAQTVADISQEVRSAEGQSDVLQLLIKFHTHLWTVPDFLLCEARLKGGVEAAAASGVGGGGGHQKISPVLRLLGLKKPRDRRDSQDHVDSQVVHVPNEIHVRLSQHHETVLVQCNSHTTVGDVISLVQSETSKGGKNSHNRDSNSSTGSHNSCSAAGDHSEIIEQGWLKAIHGDPSKKLYLFEVGGNMHRRCLSDESALMENLLALNPSAEWVIEFR